MAEDMQLGGINDSEIGSGGVDISLDARALLHKNLGDKDDLSFTSQDQVSRATGFVKSVGNVTNRSENPEQFASNHKKRAVQNIKLTNELATAQNAIAVANEREASLLAMIRQMELASANNGPPPREWKPHGRFILPLSSCRQER